MDAAIDRSSRWNRPPSMSWKLLSLCAPFVGLRPLRIDSGSNCYVYNAAFTVVFVP